jgi:hypothetical protein
VGVYSSSHTDNLYPENNNHQSIRADSSADLSIFSGIQVTESESHPGWNDPRRRRGHFKGDLGGPFRTQKKWVSPMSGSSASREVVELPLWFYPEWVTTDNYNYSGPCLPMAPTEFAWPPDISSSDTDLDILGSIAISRCSPSNPSADLSVFVGETFKDGIPAIIGGTLRKWRELSNKERRRSIGDEYLNYQFGWVPLVNDITKLCNSIVDVDTTLRQYLKDSGKLVRRQYSFPLSTSTDIRLAKRDCSPWVNPGASSLYEPGQVNLGKVYLSSKVEIRRWFRGAFTYYVPPSDTMRHDIARQVIQARKWLGLSLTPDTLWNLAPWSWAVDWFFDVGNVLQNWTDWAIDNQVLVYGYMMEHSLSEYNYTFTGPTGFHSGGNPAGVTMSIETKLRRQATPYGFGLSWDGFSNRQKAIIAALGISRSK